MPFFYFNLKFLKEVTPKNFLNILKGDKEAMKGIGSGKVIDRCVKFSWKEVKCVKKTVESSSNITSFNGNSPTQNRTGRNWTQTV